MVCNLIANDGSGGVIPVEGQSSESFAEKGSRAGPVNAKFRSQRWSYKVHAPVVSGTCQ
jgi:hypothetical protein